MLISTKGRYALRVIIDLAECGNKDYIPLKDVSARQEISEKYMESIIKLLVKDGIVEGLRGKGGGYRLVDAPECYTVGRILRLTEGTTAPVACLDENAQPCTRAASCRTLSMWMKLDDMIQNFLDGITIADLMQKEEQP